MRKGAELFREVMKSYTLYWKVLDLNILKMNNMGICMLYKVVFLQSGKFFFFQVD